VLILLVTQVFLEVIILPLGRRIPRISSSSVRLANSKARIKPTASLSAFDKENSIEFPLDLVHYIYM